jgi:CheY-like chemotaxis protein
MRPATHFPIVPIEAVPSVSFFAEAAVHRPLVLVVDDEIAVADSLVELLTKNGFAAVAAYDHADAIETAQIIPPELLVVDAGLPGITGIELANAVKSASPDCKTILISSPASNLDILAPAKHAGHEVVFLGTPDQVAGLLAQVTESLKPMN